MLGRQRRAPMSTGASRVPVTRMTGSFRPCLPLRMKGPFYVRMEPQRTPPPICGRAGF
jgi:hypothetical protein